MPHRVSPEAAGSFTILAPSVGSAATTAPKGIETESLLMTVVMSRSIASASMPAKAAAGVTRTEVWTAMGSVLRVLEGGEGEGARAVPLDLEELRAVLGRGLAVRLGAALARGLLGRGEVHALLRVLVRGDGRLADLGERLGALLGLGGVLADVLDGRVVAGVDVVVGLLLGDVHAVEVLDDRELDVTVRHLRVHLRAEAPGVGQESRAGVDALRDLRLVEAGGLVGQGVEPALSRVRPLLGLGELLLEGCDLVHVV